MYDFIHARYTNLHGKEQPEPPQNADNRAQNIRPPTREEIQNNSQSINPGYSSPPNIRNNMTPNREMNNPSMMGAGIQDPRMAEGNFQTSFPNQRKPGPQNPLINNTPTQPGKFLEPQQPSSWRNTPQQQKMKGMYTQPQPQQHSARQFETLNLGPSAAENQKQNKALKLTSKDFKPKTQQVQEHLKKDDMNTLPNDFVENLTTTLNMTGTNQIFNNARALEQEIQDDFIPQIAHYIVVRRVIESDEKRIEFISQFFS